MDRDSIAASIAEDGKFDFSRSGGPGGQNVNKVNTKVSLKVDLKALAGVTEEERARLLDKLGSRLTEGSILSIQVQDERSQVQNRQIAVDRVCEIIVAALHRDKPRRATKPTKASKERRLTAKKAKSADKKNREKPGLD